MLRQPVKNFTLVHTLIVISSIIIPIVYESLVVGNVIAPPDPPEYKNVDEFLDVFDKIILTTTSDHADEKLLLYEFEKLNITDKYKNAFEIVYNTDTSYKEIIELFKSGRKQVGVLTHLITGVIDKIKLLYDQAGMNDVYACSFFMLEQKSISYNCFGVPFLKEALRLDTTFRESGFYSLWEDLYWTKENSQNMKNQAILPGFSKLVTLLHLKMFIATWAIASGMYVFVMIIELRYTHRSTILLKIYCA